MGFQRGMTDSKDVHRGWSFVVEGNDVLSQGLLPGLTHYRLWCDCNSGQNKESLVQDVEMLQEIRIPDYERSAPDSCSSIQTRGPQTLTRQKRFDSGFLRVYPVAPIFCEFNGAGIKANG